MVSVSSGKRADARRQEDGEKLVGKSLMTLMTNDLNDHHDRVVVVEVFVYDKKKQSLTLSRVPGFLLTSNPRYNPLTSFASLY